MTLAPSGVAVAKAYYDWVGQVAIIQYFAGDDSRMIMFSSWNSICIKFMSYPIGRNSLIILYPKFGCDPNVKYLEVIVTIVINSLQHVNNFNNNYLIGCDIYIYICITMMTLRCATYKVWMRTLRIAIGFAICNLEQTLDVQFALMRRQRVARALLFSRIAFS